jgi:hypothetical protein
VRAATNNLVIAARNASGAIIFTTGATDTEKARISNAGVFTVGGVQVADVSSTQTFTNKTLTSPKVNQILDTNGNVILGFSPTTSSVNYITINNNITGWTPGIQAQGSDSVIPIYLQSKGGGGAQVDGDNIITATATQTLTNKTLTTPVISSISNTGTLTLPTSTDTIVGRATTDTLTNKRITPRIGTTTSSATPTINTDTVDQFNITALATAVTSMTTNLSGTPTDGQKLMIRFKDNGSAQTITWGTSFQSSGVATLLGSTVASKTHHVGFIYDSVAAKWTCIAVDAVGY